MEKPPVLITGASSGIGFAFAEAFAAEGHPLVCLSRTEGALAGWKDRHSASLLFIPCDLGKAAEISRVFAVLKDRGIVPRILVNNAGFANFGEFITVAPERQSELIDLNIRGLTLMTRAFLDQAGIAPGIRILNVASMAGLLPGPWIAVYAASKAFVYSFSQALASELRPRGIQVSVLCPADVKTGFQQRAGIVGGTLNLGGPEELVKKALPRFFRGRRVIMPGAGLSMMRFALRFLPESTVADSLYAARKSLTKEE